MKAFIVAEIASNWEGSISKAKKLILNCRNAGANAVKFQIWRAEDLYQKDHPEWINIKKSELSLKKVKILKTYCDSIGIEFFASVVQGSGCLPTVYDLKIIHGLDNTGV